MILPAHASNRYIPRGIARCFYQRIWTNSRSPRITPRELVKYLDQFVVGQEHAKKVLSVAIHNHYMRIIGPVSCSNDENKEGSSSILYGEVGGTSSTIPSFEKSNVLILGPTGSGKTLLVRTLARFLDLPFSVSDATAFTQAGYVGEDVDMAIQRLLQASDWNPIRASMGIVYIDEVDKIAKRSGNSSEGSRDVSGEGVQQSLLRIMEGSTVSIQSKGRGAANDPPPPPPTNEPPSPRSRQRVLNTLRAQQPPPDVFHIDTSNILFILSGAFVGLDSIVQARLPQKGGIGFSAGLDAGPRSLPFFTTNQKSVPNYLEQVEISDLVKYGFIPEFIARMPSIATLAPLTLPDLRKILTGVKGSLVSQYKSLFNHFNAELRFTELALDEICTKAIARGGGARGLRAIMETALLDAMYEVPGSDIRFVLITRDVVKGKTPASYWTAYDMDKFLEAWMTEGTI